MAQLGLQQMDTAQLATASALILSQPVSPAEAAMICLEAPAVKASSPVDFVAFSENKPNVDEMTRDQGFEACSALFKALRVSDLLMDLVKNYGYDTKAMSDLKVLNRAQGQLIMERAQHLQHQQQLQQQQSLRSGAPVGTPSKTDEWKLGSSKAYCECSSLQQLLSHAISKQNIVVQDYITDLVSLASASKSNIPVPNQPSGASEAGSSQQFYIYSIQCQETAPFQMRKDALTYTPFDSNFIMTKLKQADSKQTTTSGSITSNRQLDTQASKGYNIAKQGPTHSKQFWYLHRRGLM
ncbi:TPA: hypothetical protein ACH3X1_016452 [Trebouxia sp. C0004]